MKAKILSLFSLIALLLVSTAILADGRPTGIRIGSVTNVGASGVEIDITVPGTDYLYTAGVWATFGSVVYLNNSPGNTLPYGGPAYQFASPAHNVPLPWAIDWGDGSYRSAAGLQGPPGGPFVGTFTHTYPPAGMPMTYTITVGDVLCCSSVPPGTTVVVDEPYRSPIFLPPPGKGLAKGAGVTTGSVITGSRRYLSTFDNSYTTFNSVAYARLALTNTATVTTSTGIPALNIYGLLAMAFVLVGTGILVYRKPQRFAA
ncbi:MAG: hypothetical protein E2O56_06725 [Gammaproteobacteria bacterium]|nr:MAG: hypothetical protein E2O56_06725 [Gammaproteobacteria bacterium]